MRKYSWIVIILLIGCIVSFPGCRRMEQMMDPIMPDAEQIEPPEPEPTETPEEMAETPEDTGMTAIVQPPVQEPESPEDTPVQEPMPPPAPVAVATVEPPSGSRITPDTIIDVTFDGIPADLTVSTGELAISDANATITGPFMAGSLTLNLVWADGIQTLTYVVEEDVPPPPEGMVTIPAGDFEMGDSNPNSNGFPVHTVWVDAFYMDIYEVTNLDYKRFVLANPEWEKRNHRGGYLARWDDNNNYPEGQANYPVQNVNWHAAKAYAEWVGKRLPTEAEWEKAARGGLVGKQYALGDAFPIDLRHFNGPTPVGSYAPNGYGLYDMEINVMEFCLDHYDQDFYSVSPSRNPLNGAPPSNTIVDLDAYIDPGTDIRIVVRGPAWRGGSFSGGNIAWRRSDWPWSADAKYGIRCVQDVPR